MTLSGALATIVTDCKAPAQLTAYLLAEGLTDIEDVALLAANEVIMEEKELDMMKAGGVPMSTIDGQRSRKFGGNAGRLSIQVDV